MGEILFVKVLSERTICTCTKEWEFEKNYNCKINCPYELSAWIPDKCCSPCKLDNSGFILAQFSMSKKEKMETKGRWMLRKMSLCNLYEGSESFETPT